MGERMHAICRRDAPGLTPERCDQYRAMWSAAAHPEWFEQPQTDSASPLDCPHRGGELRRQLCPTCGGRVELKVFVCDLHGECTLAQQGIAGVANCTKCPDLPSRRPRYVSNAQPVADTYK